MKIIDWKRINEVPPSERKEKIVEAVVAYFQKIASAPIGNVKMSGADGNLTGADNPIVHRLTDTLKMPDRGYEILFDEVNMRQATTKTFDMLNITGGVTFFQQEPGEEAKLSKLPTAAKAGVSMLRFTGGFPILDDWLRFNEYYKIDELAADTVRRWWDKKATLFYGLIAALGAGADQAFVTDDVTTINTACAAMLVALEAKGYPVNENEQFIIVCHPTLRARLLKALAASFINPNTNNLEIVFPIAGMITTTKIAASSYYVAIRGGKNKRGEWEDLNARPPVRSELKLGADHIWTGAYNGVIGEIDQFRRCALS